MIHVQYVFTCDRCGVEHVQKPIWVAAPAMFYRADIQWPLPPTGWQYVDDRLMCEKHEVRVDDLE